MFGLFKKKEVEVKKPAFEVVKSELSLFLPEVKVTLKLYKGKDRSFVVKGYVKTEIAFYDVYTGNISSLFDPNFDQNARVVAHPYTPYGESPYLPQSDFSSTNYKYSDKDDVIHVISSKEIKELIIHKPVTSKEATKVEYLELRKIESKEEQYVR